MTENQQIEIMARRMCAYFGQNPDDYYRDGMTHLEWQMKLARVALGDVELPKSQLSILENV